MTSNFFSFILFAVGITYFFYSFKNRKKGSIVRGIKELLWTMVVMLLFNWLCLQLSVVPTGSMIPTILEGDVVLVSKMHYGATTPATPLHIPFTQHKIPLLGIPSYLKWIQLPIYNLPGFTVPKPGDCVVIQPPREAILPDVPPDVQVPFLKRIVAAPGDKLSIVDGKVYIDGKLAKCVGECQYKYIITSKVRLNDRFFKRHGMVKYHYTDKGNVCVYTTERVAKQLRDTKGIQGVKRVVQPKGVLTHKLAFVHFLGGNEDQLPVCTVPYKGMEVVLNKKNIIRYLGAIRECEENRQVPVEVRDNGVWIGGERVKKYRFREDCYFLVGVNWNNSYDCRGFGFVPRSSIRGKAIMVLFSGKNPQWHVLQNLLSGNLRWDRFCKIIR